MRLLALLLIVVSFVACKQACDVAKMGTTTLSQAVADRWECDQNKLYKFMIKPVNETVCKDQTKGIWDETVCPMVLDLVVNLGADEISKQFTCNAEKVTADLKNVKLLCAQLGNLINKQ